MKAVALGALLAALAACGGAPSTGPAGAGTATRNDRTERDSNGSRSDSYSPARDPGGGHHSGKGK